MAKKKSSKSKLPQEFIDEINRMAPQELAIEVFKTSVRIETDKEDLKEDSQINDLKGQVEKFDDELAAVGEVSDAFDKYEKLRDENTTTDHVNARENLKALKKAWADQTKDQKKKFKFMKQVLREHMRSGRLESKKA